MQTYILLICCLLTGVHPVIRVTGYVGKSAVIRCPYDRGYEGYSKYLCRGECPSYGHRDIPVWTREGQTKAVNGRFSLHDDNTAKVFTVNITGLTAEDSRKYWCGVERSFIKGDLYNEVYLKVIKDMSPVVTPATDAYQTTQMTKISVPTSIYEAATIPKTDVYQTTQMTKSPEPISNIGLYIPVGLGFVLLITGLICLYVKYRHCKTPHPDPPSCKTRRTYKTVADGHTVSEHDGVYANVESTRKQQGSIYQNIQLGSKGVHHTQDT
ncbi:CMRF35-like molecule 5 [Sardina pilchardus]|uniref:CMRF35-like molecule 5 n=1 Tax=Sardina pilchardus TaxID=27697 RepID=UPI002E164731